MSNGGRPSTSSMSVVKEGEFVPGADVKLASGVELQLIRSVTAAPEGGDGFYVWDS